MGVETLVKIIYAQIENGIGAAYFRTDHFRTSKGSKSTLPLFIIQRIIAIVTCLVFMMCISSVLGLFEEQRKCF